MGECRAGSPSPPATTSGRNQGSRSNATPLSPRQSREPQGSYGQFTEQEAFLSLQPQYERARASAVLQQKHFPTTSPVAPRAFPQAYVMLYVVNEHIDSP